MSGPPHDIDKTPIHLPRAPDLELAVLRIAHLGRSAVFKEREGGRERERKSLMVTTSSGTIPAMLRHSFVGLITGLCCVGCNLCQSVSSRNSPRPIAVQD